MEKTSQHFNRSVKTKCCLLVVRFGSVSPYFSHGHANKGSDWNWIKITSESFISNNFYFDLSEFFFSRREILTRLDWRRQSSDVILELKNRDALSRGGAVIDKRCRLSYQCSLQPSTLIFPSTTPFHPQLRRLQILASGWCKPEEMLKWIFK